LKYGDAMSIASEAYASGGLGSGYYGVECWEP
jgi:hypothetical protein